MKFAGVALADVVTGLAAQLQVVYTGKIGILD
jgi:hypothetical protein